MPSNVNLDTVRNLLPREFGKADDLDFKQYLDGILNYYQATLASPTLPLVYKMAKLGCLDYLLGNAAAKYDTEAIDIVEKEGQLFTHYLKLYELTQGQLEAEISSITGGNFSIGVITKQTPVPYADILYFNPNNSFFKGRPILDRPVIEELP